VNNLSRLQTLEEIIMANEEIFRFSIVRNPQLISSEKLKYSVISIISEDFDKHPNYNALKELKDSDSSREEFIRLAKQWQENDSFLKDLSQLKTRLPDFTEWIYTIEKPNYEGIIEQTQQIFGVPLPEFVDSEDFTKDKYKVSDSLVLASVAKPEIVGLRTALMQLRRVIFLLEFLAPEAENSIPNRKIRNILNATLLLPGDIFPIPDNNEKRQKEKEEAYKKRREDEEKEQQRINSALEGMKKNSDAISELSNAYKSHLFDVKMESATTNGRGGRPGTRASSNGNLSVLPVEKFRKLSQQTQEIVLKIVGSENRGDIPFVVNTLEEENNRLGDTVKSARDTSVVAHDSVFDMTCGACKIEKSKPPKAENDFDAGTRGEVKFVGTQDLLIVRQNLLKYEPGEIAHIENILKGESKKKEHRTLDRTEETIFEETETTTETEQELQTTDRYELQNEVSRTIAEETSWEAGGMVSGTYLGATNVVNYGAHGNYANYKATEDSSLSASTFAKEVISRSLQKIQERVLRSRSRTRISEVEVINTHEFDNKEGEGHVTGVYRWVDKFYQAQIVNFGKREMLEFMIPEPAAFYRFAMDKKPSKQIQMKKPDEPGFCKKGVFYPLKPEDLDPANYTCFVAKYGVTGLKPPPSQYISISDVLSHKNDPVTKPGVVPINERNESLNIPDGYHPITISYRISGSNAHRVYYGTDPDNNIFISVTIGNEKKFVWYKNEIGKVGDTDYWHDLHQNIEWGKNPHLHSSETDLGSYFTGTVSDELTIGDENLNHVPISITGHTTLPVSVAVHYTILCKRSIEHYQQWQIDTFNTIMDKYNALRLEYEEALQNQQFGFEGVQGRNPAINREIEKTELKKYAISILSGQQFEAFNAMEEDPALGYPQIDLADAAEEGQYVRFFEQALEWRHITYLFYPYFWGRKNEWVDVFNLEDIDPTFEKFLKAGFARVWVPVRPGFENALANYLCTGETWDEKDAPLCEDKGDKEIPLLSIIDEIKEQLNNDFETRDGTITINKGEKKVTGHGTDFSKEDEGRELLINLETYRIAKFISETELELRDPYKGENITDPGIGVAMGVKYVGEPWIVKVPTNLVWLQSSPELNT